MLVFHREEEEVFVVTVELQQREEDVEVGVAQSFGAVAHLHDFGVIDNVRVVPLVVFEDDDGAVNPDGELIDEVALCRLERVSAAEVGDVFGTIFPKHSFLALHVFQQHLGENEDTVFEQRVVVVAHIVNGHESFDVLQGIDAVENVLHVFHLIFVFFNEDAHVLF